MNDSRPTERFPTSQPGPQQPRYAPPADPAYADQMPYAQSYGGAASPWAPTPNETNTTRELPAYWQQDLPPSGDLPTGMAPPPPEGPKSSRWLWLGAGGTAVWVLIASFASTRAITNATTSNTAPPVAVAHPGPDTADQRPRAAARDDRAGHDARRRLHRLG